MVPGTLSPESRTGDAGRTDTVPTKTKKVAATGKGKRDAVTGGDDESSQSTGKGPTKRSGAARTPAKVKPASKKQKSTDNRLTITKSSVEKKFEKLVISRMDKIEKKVSTRKFE